MAAGRNKDFEFGICRNAGGGQAGFTLIEVIMIIVIVSVFMASIGIPLLSSLRESDLPEISTIAYFLGLEKMEELAPQTTGSISDEARAAVSGYGDYERTVVVCDVNCDTLTTSTPPPLPPGNCDPCSEVDCDPSPNLDSSSGCRKITVTVYHSRISNGVSLVSLRTAY